MLYSNGRVPDSVVSVVVANGGSGAKAWEHRLTPGTAARWKAAQEYAFAHFGRRIYITWGGWNAYRPFDVQKRYRDEACANGNCNQASVAGSSSHGGNWRGSDCLAIDVDRNGLEWWQVWESCSSAGFECNRITERRSGIDGGEPWHIIDFNAFRPLQEDDMFTDDDRRALQEVRVALGAGGATTAIADSDTVLGVVRSLRANGALSADQDNALISIWKAIFFGGGNAGPTSILETLATLVASSSADMASLADELTNQLGTERATELAHELNRRVVTD
ncbi:hypothetical protein ACH3VR_06040 [Microbacterium sp. B2969]|uniref:Peptidase M15B domain-containing protein n=1 Tax=Microbacterium alkaliflavum TaxID=3248839 RepID=A0ABW7Q4Y7_9MICO